jgi:hypothetical protein
LSIPRNTYEECINYIVSECDAVKGTLTPEPVSDSNWGKFQEELRLHSKVVLCCMLRPLFNGGGVSTNANLKALMGYPTYDANRWQKALDAANELIGLNYYALQTSFSGVFTTKKNTEIILAKQSGNNFLIENYNAPVGFGSPSKSGLDESFAKLS